MKENKKNQHPSFKTIDDRKIEVTRCLGLEHVKIDKALAIVIEEFDGFINSKEWSEKFSSEDERTIVEWRVGFDFAKRRGLIKKLEDIIDEYEWFQVTDDGYDAYIIGSVTSWNREKRETAKDKDNAAIKQARVNIDLAKDQKKFIRHQKTHNKIIKWVFIVNMIIAIITLMLSNKGNPLTKVEQVIEAPLADPKSYEDSPKILPDSID